jgi:hypothetical protein
MPDDPNKKGADRKRISKQTHEQAYQKRKASKTNGDTNNKRNSGNGSRSSGSGRSIVFPVHFVSINAVPVRRLVREGNPVALACGSNAYNITMQF